MQQPHDKYPFRDPYIRWVQEVEPTDFDFDLGSSGLSLDWDWAAWGIDATALPADDANWQGHDPLRRRIAARLEIPAAQVTLAAGTTGANTLVVASLVRPGDRVLFETPMYTILENLVRGFGGVCERIPREEARGWQFDLEAFEAAVRGCRLCVITNPHNPTGRLLAPGAIERLAAACRREGTTLVVDEVYREFPGADREASAVTMGDDVIVTASMTKAYGLGGLRVGWVAGPASTMDRVFDTNRVLAGRGSVPGEWLVERVMANEAKWDALRRSIAERVEANRALMAAFVAEFEHLRWVEPEVGICGLLRLPAGVSGEAIAGRARDEARVYLVPGEFFGAPESVRLSFGAPTDRVRAAIERVRPVFQAVDAEAGGEATA